MESSSPPTPPARRGLIGRITNRGVLGVLGVLGAVCSLVILSTLVSVPGGAKSTGVDLAASSSGTQYHVDIANYAFSPATLTVHVGDTVTWTNKDSAAHTVTVTDGPEKFDSGMLKQGQSFSYTFQKVGTDNYYCSVHPDMKGSVTVQDSGSAPPPSAQPSSSPPSSSPAPMPGMSSSPNQGSGNSQCIPPSVWQSIVNHIERAHLQESPSQQVADAANPDQWIKTHTVWIENTLQPLYGSGSQQVAAQMESAIIQHIQTAHLQESPSQQAADAANTDQWTKTHTVWLQNVFSPLFGQMTCTSGSGTTQCIPPSVWQSIVNHIEMAHLQESPSQQVADAANPDQWIKTHTVWIENTLQPLYGSGSQQVAAQMESAIIQHIQTAHLQESPSQQATDLLDLDQWTKTHTVWLQNVFSPLFGQLTC